MAELQGSLILWNAEGRMSLRFPFKAQKMGPIRIHPGCDSSPCSVCDRKVHRAYPGLLIFHLARYEKAKR